MKIAYWKFIIAAIVVVLTRAICSHLGERLTSGSRAIAADSAGAPALRESTNAATLDPSFLAADFSINPYDRQVSEQVARLKSPAQYVRSAAAEALGYLRAYSKADLVAEALGDRSPIVRREAAMALAWCGGRGEVGALLRALEDEDWVTRQAAWVSLTNLTGMEWPFDAFAKPDLQKSQIRRWSEWWQEVTEDLPPQEVLELTGADDDERRLRGVRALGALGGRGATEAVLDLLTPFLRRESHKLNPLEKHLVQSCIRSLGRLQEPQALPVLIDLLQSASLARYAADALGDFGDVRAIRPLLAVYPKFARNLTNRLDVPESVPRDDRSAGDNTQDRMYETPYAIAMAVARLPLDRQKDLEALRQIGPLLVANLPSDWDGGVFYDIEAYQLITAYLLEKASLRQAVCEAAFESIATPQKWVPEGRRSAPAEDLTTAEYMRELSLRRMGDVPYVAAWLPAFCRREDVPRLMGPLKHQNGWIRINAAKALMFIGDRRAVEPLARLLAASKPEAEYGFSGALEHAEYNDPTPRWREAFVRALGRLGATEHDLLLVKILQDERNVVDLQHAAALALDELGTQEALAALKHAEANHPFHSVRLVAREALWRRGLDQENRVIPSLASAVLVEGRDDPQAPPSSFVFIKGARKMRSDFNGQAGVDPWRQTYTVNNPGPTMRLGRNLYILKLERDGKSVSRLTHFERGYVADCEVSWDGKRILFARRRNNDNRSYHEVPYEEPSVRKSGEFQLDGDDDPWWHIWEVNVDGTDLRQITRGPYHDVQPTYLPDGRVVFSSSRTGLRDEYHGYPAVGLTVMNRDGSDIHVIGFNLGGDREPAVMSDGRIVFSRLDVFYSRLKSELTVQAAYPDGTKNVVLYGPERRAYWMGVHRKYAAWTMRTAYGESTDNRNRVLRLSQPQPFGDGRVVCASSGGLVLVGPRREQETLIPHDRQWAVTSPFPLGNGKVLCAATIKQFKVGDRIVTCGTEEFEELEKGPELFRSAVNIDLGLYVVDAKTGEMELLYNDPETAEFEARPIIARRRPPLRAEGPPTRMGSYTARLFCSSARNSRNPRVRSRGKWLRVIEGQPVVSRHQSQKSLFASADNRWKNHGGTHARVLGTLPLAVDGSFFIEVPADRLLHLQVLDGDRKVIGNQLFWMYVRPGEIRSCVGCHEKPDITVPASASAPTLQVPAVKMLPTGGEFSYRAKAWIKGVLSDESEERTRSVRAVNLIARQ